VTHPVGIRTARTVTYGWRVRVERRLEIGMLNAVIGKLLVECAALVCAGVVLSGCSPSKPNPPAPQAAALWGDMKPVVSVKELMRYMLDPASDNIFDAAKIETTKAGTVERLPKTDEDWEKIRIGAVTLAEGVYLLKVPRPFAPAGDENNSKGPEPSELSPAQIKAKLDADPVLWNAKIEALRNVALEVLDIVKDRKTEELWEAGDNLDQACEACHIQYWYPGDKALLEKVDRSLRELNEHTPAPDKGRRGR
jgi:cytochrome c556